MSNIKKVSVIGAGTMGAGIVQVFAGAGYEVTLVDVDNEVLKRGIATIEKSLDRQIRKEKISEDDKTGALGRIRKATHISDTAGSQLVIEAITENADLKTRVWREINESLGKDAILASNTSSISITALASAVTAPNRFVGMHFMNPVPMMKLVEVIRGLETDDATVDATRTVCEKLGKVPIEVQDYPGFVANRILMPMINEAVFALMEGVATRESIDEVMKLGMAHPMGPLALADLIGLDVCLSIMEVLQRDLGDSKYRPCPLLRKMVAAGRLGRKTGRGFYEHGGK